MNTLEMLLARNKRKRELQKELHAIELEEAREDKVKREVVHGADQQKIDLWFGGDIGGLTRKEALKAIALVEQTQREQDDMWASMLYDALAELDLWDKWRSPFVKPL